MFEIDELYVDAAAPNAGAIKKGRELVLKKKFIALNKSEDDTLLFGECQGSGKSGYNCSADFINPASPVFRCNCPSRQFPCKHSLGLLYAYVANAGVFVVAEIPEDILAKRDKAERRAEKKKETAAKPKKVNLSALKKKIAAQLEGLELLQTLTYDLIRLGVGNMNAKSSRQIEDKAKLLGNLYLPGAQDALYGFTSLFYNDSCLNDDLTAGAREAVYSEAVDQLTRLQAICNQGKKYLTSRLEDPDLKPETGSTIATWLGHTWQLTELRDLGLVDSDTELIQLSYNSYDNLVRKMYIDSGIWMNMKSGDIQVTQNFRPYKAAKYINEDDSCFQAIQLKELMVYPGDLNPRVRWDEMSTRKLENSDFKKLKTLAKPDFNQVIKQVKNQLKSPLADKYPVALLAFSRIAKVGDDFVMEDSKGTRLVLRDITFNDEPKTLNLLALLEAEYLVNQAMTVRFYHDIDEHTLTVKPLSVVTDSDIVRLVY